MKIIITIDGTERVYQGDYEELHARDWNERVRDQIDSIKEVNESI
jgi:hypothetical protein